MAGSFPDSGGEGEAEYTPPRGKLWVWVYAARGRRLLGASPDAPTVGRITRRSCALPVTCGLVALTAGLGFTQAFFGFALIPLVAWFLDRAGAPLAMKRGVAR